MTKSSTRIITVLLSQCLIIDPTQILALMFQQQTTAAPSVIVRYDFREQALATRAVHQDHFLDQKVGEQNPRIEALRLEASASSTGVGGKSSNDSHTSADDRPVLVRAFPATLGQFLCKTFGHSGGMISLDGPTGHGKSTFADALERETDRTGFTGNIVVILLDDFHRPSGWRYAMAKVSVGEQLHPKEAELLTADDQARAMGSESHLIEESFYQNDAIQTTLHQIRQVIDSPPQEKRRLTFAVNAYDRTSERTHEKFYTIRQGDIVIVEGKYANREELTPLYDFRVRLVAPDESIQRRYEQRTRALNPEKIALRLKFYFKVVWPSWLAYAQRTHSQIDLVIDLESRDEAYQDLEKQMLHVLDDGPLTGRDLMRKFPSIPADLLWQVVMLSRKIQTTFAGIHYPRIALGKPGAPISNLSPSPMREFYSYTAIGRVNDARIAEKVETLNRQRKSLSARKLYQARTIVYELAHQLTGIKVAVALSGDVTKEMAHAESRYNLSSGQMMQGSDFDFIILADKATPADISRIQTTFMWAQDIMIAQGIDPVEADYDVFQLPHITELSPDSAIDLMHAKNILQSQFLFGDPHLLEQAQTTLRESMISKRLSELTREAHQKREFTKIALIAKDTKDWSQKDIEFFLGSFESFAEAGKLIGSRNGDIAPDAQSITANDGSLVGVLSAFLSLGLTYSLANFSFIPSRILPIFFVGAFSGILWFTAHLAQMFSTFLWPSDPRLSEAHPSEALTVRFTSAA